MPFLAFAPEVRKGHLHDQHDRVAELPDAQDHQDRGQFPNDDAVTKLLWPAILDIEDQRADARAKKKGAHRNSRKAPGHLIEGASTHGWRAAINALDLAYPGRLPAGF